MDFYDDDPRGLRKKKSLGAKLKGYSNVLLLVFLLVSGGGWFMTHSHRKQLHGELQNVGQSLSHTQSQLREKEAHISNRDREVDELRRRLERLQGEMTNTHEAHMSARRKLEDESQGLKQASLSLQARVDDYTKQLEATISQLNKCEAERKSLALQMEQMRLQQQHQQLQQQQQGVAGGVPLPQAQQQVPVAGQQLHGGAVGGQANLAAGQGMQQAVAGQQAVPVPVVTNAQVVPEPQQQQLQQQQAAVGVGQQATNLGANVGRGPAIQQQQQQPVGQVNSQAGAVPVVQGQAVQGQQQAAAGHLAGGQQGGQQQVVPGLLGAQAQQAGGRQQQQQQHDEAHVQRRHRLSMLEQHLGGHHVQDEPHHYDPHHMHH